MKRLRNEAGTQEDRVLEALELAQNSLIGHEYVKDGGWVNKQYFIYEAKDDTLLNYMLTKPIPAKMRAEMAEDKFYKTCCLEILGECAGVIQWHHAVEQKGARLNLKFAIVPLCYRHHRDINIGAAKELVDWIVLNRASLPELAMISKAINYLALRERLNKKYGKPCVTLK